MGYRWFQGQGHRTPLRLRPRPVPYTTFDITDLQVDLRDGATSPVVVAVSVTNTGPVAGAEVV